VISQNIQLVQSEIIQTILPPLIGFTEQGSTGSQPPKPTGCMLSGAAVCGFADFQCNPLDAADEIVVIPGMAVTSVQPSIGLINGTYLTAGTASVSVCAKKSGFQSCSDPINVTFGPSCASQCTGDGEGPQRCPTGEIFCDGGCTRPRPDCLQP
jgi:hypothetical protein